MATFSAYIVPNIGNGGDITGSISQDGVTDYSGYKVASYGIWEEWPGHVHHYGPMPGTRTVYANGNFTISGWSQYNINDAKIALIIFPDGNVVSYNGDVVTSTIVTRQSDVVLDAISSSNRFTGSVTLANVPRRGITTPITGTITPPSGGSIAQGTRVALYAVGTWDGQNHLYGPKKSVYVTASTGAFELADWSLDSSDENGEFFALIVCNPTVAIPSYGNGEVVPDYISSLIQRKTTTITAEAPRMGVGYAITGTVVVTGITNYSGYKVAVYGVSGGADDVPRLYGYRAIAVLSSNGLFSVSGWAQYDIDARYIALYAYPSSETPPQGDWMALPRQSYTIVERAPSAPDAPLLVKGIIGAITISGQPLTIYFNPPAKNGGSDITGYTVTLTKGTTSITQSGTSSPITIPNFSSADTHILSVCATNSVGNSVASNVIEINSSTVESSLSNPSVILNKTANTITLSATTNSPKLAFTADYTAVGNIKRQYTTSNLNVSANNGIKTAVLTQKDTNAISSIINRPINIIIQAFPNGSFIRLGKEECSVQWDNAIPGINTIKIVPSTTNLGRYTDYTVQTTGTATIDSLSIAGISYTLANGIWSTTSTTPADIALLYGSSCPVNITTNLVTKTWSNPVDGIASIAMEPISTTVGDVCSNYKISVVGTKTISALSIGANALTSVDNLTWLFPGNMATTLASMYTSLNTHPFTTITTLAISDAVVTSISNIQEDSTLITTTASVAYDAISVASAGTKTALAANFATAVANATNLTPEQQIATLLTTGNKANVSNNDIKEVFTQQLIANNILEPNVPFTITTPAVIAQIVNSIPSGFKINGFNPTSALTILAPAADNTITIDMTNPAAMLLLAPDKVYTLNATKSGVTSTDTYTVKYKRTDDGSRGIYYGTGFKSKWILGSNIPFTINGAKCNFTIKCLGHAAGETSEDGGGGGGGGGAGDPYVRTVKGDMYKLPAFNGNLRLYQGMLNGKLLTVNASTKIDDNKEAMDADNAAMTADIGLPQDAPVMDSAMSFFHKVFVSYDNKTAVFDIYDKFTAVHNDFPVENAGTLNKYLADWPMYKHLAGNVYKVRIADNAYLRLSTIPIRSIRNSVEVYAPNMEAGNGALVTMMSRKNMQLKKLTDAHSIQQKTAAPKRVIHEEFVSSHGTEKASFAYLA
jgi:hypothetical protein